MKIFVIVCLVTHMISGGHEVLAGACTSWESQRIGCRNGGTCRMTGTRAFRAIFSCDCPNGFEGNKCERPQSGNCPPGTKTTDTDGRCCAFPFIYRGRTYNSCTTAWHNRFWCSFDAEYSGQWADCACNDADAATKNCLNGGTCVNNDDGSLACVCIKPFQGDRCEVFRSGRVGY